MKQKKPKTEAADAAAMLTDPRMVRAFGYEGEKTIRYGSIPGGIVASFLGSGDEPFACPEW